MLCGLGLILGKWLTMASQYYLVWIMLDICWNAACLKSARQFNFIGKESLNSDISLTSIFARSIHQVHVHMLTPQTHTHRHN